MEYGSVPKENWQRFFDTFGRIVEAREAEVEVIGLDLGDQVEAEWLPVTGLTYDSRADTFYVYLERDENDLGHAIAHPREILVRMGADVLEQVVILDEDEHKTIIRLRQPIRVQLPNVTG